VLVLICGDREADTGSGYRTLRVPGAAAALLCVLIAAAGIALARFNVNNLVCDRYFLIAMSMEKRGANRRALAAAQTAHARNPHRMDVLSTLGRACITTGKTKRGISALKKATTGHPYHLNALFILGVGYAHAGMNKEALETFKKVLRIKPDFPEAKKIIATIKSRGRASVNLG
jgi:Flp pilus assembly protein TadD